jgi:hypothetical protein
MNELVREIEEDIRRERLDKLWHSFGRVMVMVSIAVVLATIGVVIFQNHTRSQAMDKTSQMLKGLDRINIEDFKGAIPIFEELSQDKNSTYYGLAMLRKAQAQLALGQKEDAKKTYDALAANDPFTGPLAQLLGYSIAPKADEVFPSPDKNSPLYYSVSEFRGWQLLKAGKKDQAIDQFMALIDDEKILSGMRERLLDVVQHIAPDKLAAKSKIKDAQHE